MLRDRISCIWFVSSIQVCCCRQSRTCKPKRKKKPCVSAAVLKYAVVSTASTQQDFQKEQQCSTAAVQKCEKARLVWWLYSPQGLQEQIVLLWQWHTVQHKDIFNATSTPHCDKWLCLLTDIPVVNYCEHQYTSTHRVLCSFRYFSLHCSCWSYCLRSNFFSPILSHWWWKPNAEWPLI